MRWINGETWESESKRLSEWHVWFAWHPVVVDTTVVNGRTRKVKVWLQRIYRKGTLHHVLFEAWWSWEYKDRFTK